MPEEKYFYIPTSERKYTEVMYEKKAPIAYVTLNRPEKLNALNTADGGLCDQLHDACLEAEADDDVRVIVIKGEGRGFSSGYDLARVDKMTDEEFRATGRSPEYAHEAPRMYQARKASFRGNISGSTRRWLEAIWENQKPVIAQVHGYCLAGGNDLAGMCDITIASEDALFGYPPVRYVSAAVSSLWPYQIGMKHSKYLLFTGGMITAQKAYEWGLVNEVVPRDKLEERVNNIAQTIALVPWVSVYGAKVMVNKYFEIMGMYTALGSLSDYQHMVHESDPGHTGFFKTVREKGLKAALADRDAKFAPFDINPDMRARRYDK